MNEHDTSGNFNIVVPSVGVDESRTILNTPSKDNKVTSVFEAEVQDGMKDELKKLSVENAI